MVKLLRAKGLNSAVADHTSQLGIRYQIKDDKTWTNQTFKIFI